MSTQPPKPVTPPIPVQLSAIDLTVFDSEGQAQREHARFLSKPGQDILAIVGAEAVVFP